LLVGRKKWALLPPGTSEEYLKLLGTKEYAKKPPSYWWLDVFPKLAKMAGLGMIEYIQEAGETIYVPAGWWHAIINLDFTVAVTENVLQPSLLPKVGGRLASEWPGFCNYFRTILPEEQGRYLVADVETTSVEY